MVGRRREGINRMRTKCFHSTEKKIREYVEDVTTECKKERMIGMQAELTK